MGEGGRRRGEYESPQRAGGADSPLTSLSAWDLKMTLERGSLTLPFHVSEIMPAPLLLVMNVQCIHCGTRQCLFESYTSIVYCPPSDMYILHEFRQYTKLDLPFKKGAFSAKELGKIKISAPLQAAKEKTRSVENLF